MGEGVAARVGSRVSVGEKVSHSSLRTGVGEGVRLDGFFSPPFGNTRAFTTNKRIPITTTKRIIKKKREGFLGGRERENPPKSWRGGEVSVFSFPSIRILFPVSIPPTALFCKFGIMRYP